MSASHSNCTLHLSELAYVENRSKLEKPNPQKAEKRLKILQGSAKQSKGTIKGLEVEKSTIQDDLDTARAGRSARATITGRGRKEHHPRR